MISIIMPVYNQPKALDRCLASILAQTYSNYELIIVNDRSTTRMGSIIRKYKREFATRLEIVNNQVNHGGSYSRNKGLRRAKGEYVLFCDSDLVLKPAMLATMLQVLKDHPEASYAYCAHYYGHKQFKLWPFDSEKLRQMPYIHTSSLIRREHIPAVGWDPALKKLQDWDFWLSCLDEGHIGVYIPEPLYKIIPGGIYSNWLPKIAYRLLPFLPAVRRYNVAMRIVKEKHGLE